MKKSHIPLETRHVNKWKRSSTVSCTCMPQKVWDVWQSERSWEVLAIKSVALPACCCISRWCLEKEGKGEKCWLRQPLGSWMPIMKFPLWALWSCNYEWSFLLDTPASWSLWLWHIRIPKAQMEKTWARLIRIHLVSTEPLEHANAGAGTRIKIAVDALDSRFQ
jgi:hypothetical protein